MKKIYATMKNRPNSQGEPKDLSREWHSDCMFSHLNTSSGPLAPLHHQCHANHCFSPNIGLFEECPADFSFLRMQDTPPSGGDTLWVSGYELYVQARLHSPSISPLFLLLLFGLAHADSSFLQIRPPLSPHASLLRISYRHMRPTRLRIRNESGRLRSHVSPRFSFEH